MLTRVSHCSISIWIPNFLFKKRSCEELLVKGFLVNIIEAAYVPAINGALHEGIPLPNLLGIKYEHADIHVSEVTSFYVYKGCQLQVSCREGGQLLRPFFSDQELAK
ncbi:unnamed protein product, partial [Caretta caretta]